MQNGVTTTESDTAGSQKIEDRSPEGLAAPPPGVYPKGLRTSAQPVTAGLCATARAWQQPQRPRQVDGGGGSGYGQDAVRSGEREGNPAVRGDMDGARGQYAEMSRTEEDEGRVTHL